MPDSWLLRATGPRKGGGIMTAEWDEDESDAFEWDEDESDAFRTRRGADIGVWENNLICRTRRTKDRRLMMGDNDRHRRQGKLRFITVATGVVLVVLGLSCLVLAHMWLHQNEHYQTWPHEYAKVVDVTCTTTIEGSETLGPHLVDHCTPTLQFTAAGVTETYIGAPPTNYYVINMNVSIVYDPDDPSIVLLQQPHADATVRALSAAGIIGAVLGVCLAGGYIVTRLRRAGHPLPQRAPRVATSPESTRFGGRRHAALVVIGAVFVVVGGCLVAVGGVFLNQNHQYATWPHVDATVVSVAGTSTATPIKGGRVVPGFGYAPTLQYDADGSAHTYVGAPMAVQCTVGQHIQIVVNPNDPSDILLQQPHVGTRAWVLSGTGVAGVVLGGLLLRFSLVGASTAKNVGGVPHNGTIHSHAGGPVRAGHPGLHDGNHPLARGRAGRLGGGHAVALSNLFAHNQAFASDNTVRALDTVEGLPRAVNSESSAGDVRKLRLDPQVGVAAEQNRTKLRHVGAVS
jgi:hypothetical protein